MYKEIKTIVNGKECVCTGSPTVLHKVFCLIQIKFRSRRRLFDKAHVEHLRGSFNYLVKVITKFTFYCYALLLESRLFFYFFYYYFIISTFPPRSK